MGVRASQCPCGARPLTPFKPGENEPQPVYEWQHLSTNKYSYHFEPAWHGEAKTRFVFFAYADQVMGTEPIYEFWHRTLQEHVYHFDGPETDETKKDFQFYAFRSMPNLANVRGEVVGVYTVPYVDIDQTQDGPKIKLDSFYRRPQKVVLPSHFYAFRTTARAEHPKIKPITFSTPEGLKEGRTPASMKVETTVSFALVKKQLSRKYGLGEDIEFVCGGVELDDAYKIMDYTLQDAARIIVLMPSGGAEMPF